MRELHHSHRLRALIQWNQGDVAAESGDLLQAMEAYHASTLRLEIRNGRPDENLLCSHD
jgi:hypothetical protein